MKLLTFAQRMGVAVFLISVAILVVNLVETKRALEQARLDHDALLVRIAVVQNQIDEQTKACDAGLFR